MKDMKLESKISTFRLEDDSRFAKCKLIVCHDGENVNGSYFDSEVILNCAKRSLYGTPILANVYQDDDGEWKVGGHDIEFELLDTNEGFDIRKVCIEKPCGFIPPDSPIECMQMNDRCYLTTEGVIWKNYAEQLMDILKENNNELSVSMEISVNDSHINKEELVVINDFNFEGITILGTDISPAMKGANIKLFSMQEIKSELEELIQAYSEEQGGDTVEEKDQVVEVADDIVEEVVEEVKEVEEVEEEVTDGAEDIKSEEVAVEEVEEEVTEEFEEIVEKTNVSREISVDGEIVEEVVETCESTMIIPDPEPMEEEVLDVDEYAQLQEKYANLEQAYAELEAKLNAMSDYEELKAFKESYDKAEYEQKVEEIYSMFSVEAEDLKEMALSKEISLEQFQEKLALKVFMLKGNKKFSAKKEVSSEAVIISKDTSHRPYGGKFDKYLKK